MKSEKVKIDKSLSKLVDFLACPTGFEPAASRVGVLRAIQLRYGQILTVIVYHIYFIIARVMVEI